MSILIILSGETIQKVDTNKKEFAQVGANQFLLEWPFFRNGFGVQRKVVRKGAGIRSPDQPVHGRSRIKNLRCSFKGNNYTFVVILSKLNLPPF